MILCPKRIPRFHRSRFGLQQQCLFDFFSFSSWWAVHTKPQTIVLQSLISKVGHFLFSGKSKKGNESVCFSICLVPLGSVFLPTCSSVVEQNFDLPFLSIVGSQECLTSPSSRSTPKLKKSLHCRSVHLTNSPREINPNFVRKFLRKRRVLIMHGTTSN